MTPAGYFLYNEEYEEWEETHAGTPNSVPLYTHSANPYQSITDTKIEPTVVSYTHPVKDLTLDEMRQVINETVENVTVAEMAMFLDVSKAILRKAQEK